MRGDGISGCILLGIRDNLRAKPLDVGIFCGLDDKPMRLDNVGDVGEAGSADDVKPAETDFRRDGKIFMRFSAVEQNQHAGICSNFLPAIANRQSTVIDKDCLTDIQTGFSCAGKIVLRIAVIDADVRRVI